MISAAGNVPPGVVLRGGKVRTAKKRSSKRTTRKRSVKPGFFKSFSFW